MKSHKLYTLEEDERIRSIFVHPHGSIRRNAAVSALSVELNRTEAALRTRISLFEKSTQPAYPRIRRPFTTEEDDIIMAVPYGSREAHWQALAQQLECSPIRLKHRRLALLKERDKKKEAAHPQPDFDARYIPVSEPVWFERRLTRDRLMAGR